MTIFADYPVISGLASWKMLNGSGHKEVPHGQPAGFNFRNKGLKRSFSFITMQIGLVVPQCCSLGLDTRIIYMGWLQDLCSVCCHKYEIQIGMSTGPK